MREQNKVSIVEQKLKETDTLLSQKLSEIEKVNATLIETQESLLRENSSLKEEIKNKENRNSILTEEKVQLQKAFSKKQEESSALHKKIEELQIILNRNETINTHNIAEIGRLESENKRSKMELEGKCEEVEKANATIGELTISTKGQESTIENLRERLKAESQEKESLKATINDLQSKKNNLQSQIDSLQTSYDNLKREYKYLNSDNRQPLKNNSNEANKSTTDINSNDDGDGDGNVDGDGNSNVNIENVMDIDKESNTEQKNEKIDSSLEPAQNGTDSINKINPTFTDVDPADCKDNNAPITGDGAHNLEKKEQSRDTALGDGNNHPKTLIENSTGPENNEDNNNEKKLKKMKCWMMTLFLMYMIMV